MDGLPDRLLKWLTYNPNEELFDLMVLTDLIDFNYRCEILGTSLLWLASYNDWSPELIKKLFIGGADPLQACSDNNTRSFLSSTLCDFKYSIACVILSHLKDINQLDKINKNTLLSEIDDNLYDCCKSEKEQTLYEINKLLTEYGV